MKVITLKDYQNTSSDFKGKFSDFQGLHPELKGKRTILDYQNGSTVLLIEGKSLFIVKASDKVKTFGTDLTEILNTANIKAIFTTGKKAYQLYQKYIYPKTKIEAIYLPSTSPANCKKGIEDLLKREYQKIKNFTD